MPSAIDATKPTAGSATTQSVRDNFAAAKSEIETLQTQITGNASANNIHNAPSKTTPVGLDEVGIWDSVTGLLNKVSFTNMLNWFAAKLGNASNVFSVAAATAVAHAVNLGQMNGATGAIGEKITYTVASGSAVVLTTNTPANIGAGQSLSAGKWTARGFMGYTQGAGTNVTRFSQGVGTLSASEPGNSSRFPFSGDPNIAANGAIRFPITETTFTLGTTTTVYAVATAIFTVAGLSAYCTIEFERTAL